jgi:hypothetical protein
MKFISPSNTMLPHAASMIALLFLSAIAAAQPPSPAAKQSPRPARQRETDQFYANDDGQYGWTVSTRSNSRRCNWFVKNPAYRDAYRQVIVLIYDDEPDKALYLDPVDRRVIGRLELATEKFALLAPDKQKVRGINQFPPAGALPNIHLMFEPLPAGEANQHYMQLPPPTLQFPRLQHSTWETCYMSADKFLIRSVLQFDGDRGTYQLTQKPGTGQLSNVTYERQADEHVIHGNWNLGRASGQFKFNVPADNLNVFWGEFSFQDGRPVGAWSGIRRPSRAWNESEKTVR